MPETMPEIYVPRLISQKSNPFPARKHPSLEGTVAGKSRSSIRLPRDLADRPAGKPTQPLIGLLLGWSATRLAKKASQSMHGEAAEGVNREGQRSLAGRPSVEGCEQRRKVQNNGDTSFLGRPIGRRLASRPIPPLSQRPISCHRTSLMVIYHRA